jgi:hypothetical protein
LSGDDNIPLKRAPKMGVCICHEYWHQCAECTNDRERKELMRSFETVLGKAAKVWHVDSQTAEKANYDVEACQGAVRSVHVRRREFVLAFDERTTTWKCQHRPCNVSRQAYPLVTITAHRNKARKVGGTTTPLTQNNTLSFDIGIRARPV